MDNSATFIDFTGQSWDIDAYLEDILGQMWDGGGITWDRGKVRYWVFYSKHIKLCINN